MPMIVTSDSVVILTVFSHALRRIFHLKGDRTKMKTNDYLTDLHWTCLCQALLFLISVDVGRIRWCRPEGFYRQAKWSRVWLCFGHSLSLVRQAYRYRGFHITHLMAKCFGNKSTKLTNQQFSTNFSLLISRLPLQ